MSQFMLLLRGGEFGGHSPHEMQELTTRYIKWMTKVTAQGRVVGGAPLKDGGKVLHGAHASTRVTDGPYAETKEVLGGYYLVEARSEADVVEFARDCPHLEVGGTVEVRQIGEIDAGSCQATDR